jgi:nucleoside-diphosphate-sugar epimerase
MACYLIAGAAGYVGSRLARRLLAQGRQVRGLVRDPDADVVQELAAKGMVVWTGDVTQPESLIGVAEGVQYVYNLTGRLVLENGSVRHTCVDGNQNLIAACSRSHSVRAYIFTSSAAPYGDSGETLVTEDSPVQATSPLGQVMIEAEQTIMELVRRHNFPAIILRVGTIYGPERDFVDSLLSNTVTIIGSGRNFVPRIHIDDLLTVLELMAERGQPGAIYNVADDDPARLIDFYGEVRRRLGMVPPRTLPIENALHAGLDPSVVSVSAASVRMSNARMKHDLEVELRFPSYRLWLDERLGIEQAVGV